MWALISALSPWLPSDGPAQSLSGTPNSAAMPPSVITEPINSRRLVRLSGNTRPEASARNDRGRAPDSLLLPHLQLLLRRPVARELALQESIHDLHDRTSSRFHRWLASTMTGTSGINSPCMAAQAAGA